MRCVLVGYECKMRHYTLTPRISNSRGRAALVLLTSRFDIYNQDKVGRVSFRRCVKGIFLPHRGTGFVAMQMDLPKCRAHALGDSSIAHIDRS